MSELKRFPILRPNKNGVLWIPWDMLTPHEEQARKNHYQSLARLAERGGLGADEAVAILEDRDWKRMPGADEKLAELIEAWLEED